MFFVGVDLTSAFAQRRRSVDIAVLNNELRCQLMWTDWPDASLVTKRDSAALSNMLAKSASEAQERVLAIDGPQGLAAIGQKMRHCEKELGTPGRSPDTLPSASAGGAPFQGYIRSSVDLFAALLGATPAPTLVGLNSPSDMEATLYEVFPGAEWTVIAGCRLPKKASRIGRIARRHILASLGISGLPEVPTPDMNDAAVGAYLAWCTRHAHDRVCLRGIPPTTSEGELREGCILHAADTLDEAMESQPEEDWASDEDLSLKLTDTGLVHFTCPENSWMIPGTDYQCETLPPAESMRFQLKHSKKFSGDGGWTVEPTVPKLLSALGYSPADNLSKENAATLRVRLVSSSI